MAEPFMAEDGTYERSAILGWLEITSQSPSDIKRPVQQPRRFGRHRKTSRVFGWSGVRGKDNCVA
jgi:hypothetical protein